MSIMRSLKVRWSRRRRIKDAAAEGRVSFISSPTLMQETDGSAVRFSPAAVSVRERTYVLARGRGSECREKAFGILAIHDVLKEVHRLCFRILVSSIFAVTAIALGTCATHLTIRVVDIYPPPRFCQCSPEKRVEEGFVVCPVPTVNACMSRIGSIRSEVANVVMLVAPDHS